MLRFKHILIGTLLAGTLGCRPDNAGFKAIDDRAHLFGADAVQDADFEIRDVIKRDYRKELKIETFAKVPPLRDPLGKLDKKDEAYRDQFFNNWARDRARNVDGIYVLIYQDRVQVEVSRPTRQYFSSEDADELREMLLAGVREQHADVSLRHGVKYVEERLKATIGRIPSPQPFDWLTMTALVVALSGAWIVLEGMLSARTGSFQSGYAGVSAVGHGLDGNVLAGLRQAVSRPEDYLSHDASPSPSPLDETAPYTGPANGHSAPAPSPPVEDAGIRGNTHDAL